MRIRSKCAWSAGCAILLTLAQPARSQTASSSGEPPSGGWRKFGEATPAEQAPAYAYPTLPPVLTLPAGTWIKIRVDQPLSSDRNHPGDQFTATLMQPLIVDGFVVARAGQTVGGQITSVEKAGRVKGTSQMGLELTDLTVADGRQIPIRSQLIEYTGDTSKGRDAAAIVGTTGLGAAIGGAVDGGFGAGIGALAGAAASIAGVLATRGYPVVVGPESVLTFRTLDPLPVSTDAGERAFLPAGPQDYQPPVQRRVTLPAPGPYPPPYGAPYPAPYPGPYPFAWGAWGPWGYGAPWYGASVFIYSGPRYYRPWGYGFGGYYRRGWHR
jgi:hypothetical protein